MKPFRAAAKEVYPCPPHGELIQYYERELFKRRFDEIELHKQICQSCRRYIQFLFDQGRDIKESLQKQQSECPQESGVVVFRENELGKTAVFPVLRAELSSSSDTAKSYNGIVIQLNEEISIALVAQVLGDKQHLQLCLQGTNEDIYVKISDRQKENVLQKIVCDGEWVDFGIWQNGYIYLSFSHETDGRTETWVINNYFDITKAVSWLCDAGVPSKLVPPIE